VVSFEECIRNPIRHIVFPEITHRILAEVQ
jgi:hypothetical protein